MNRPPDFGPPDSLVAVPFVRSGEMSGADARVGTAVGDGSGEESELVAAPPQATATAASKAAAHRNRLLRINHIFLIEAARTSGSGYWTLTELHVFWMRTMDRRVSARRLKLLRQITVTGLKGSFTH